MLNFDLNYDEVGEVAVRDPHDMERARMAFKKYEDEIQKLNLEAKALKVLDGGSAIIATNAAGGVATLIKKIEAERKRIIEKPDGFVRAVNGFVKRFRDQLEGISKELKSKIGEYQYKKMIEIREEERRIVAETAKREAELNQMARDVGIKEEIKLPPPVLPEKKTTIRSGGGTASIRMEWTFDDRPEFIDLKLVPLEYLVLDHKKIRDAIKAGIREIPGIKIYERPVPIVRAT